MENFRRLEGMTKGYANHRRIQIMLLLEKNPEFSVDEIAESLRVNFKTISAHIKRLAISGLVMKRSDGKSIRHKLTDRGAIVLTFLKNLQ
ncbi:MAG: winged helix-turn-helix domain-containing protein [Phycisphaerae bacterium]